MERRIPFAWVSPTGGVVVVLGVPAFWVGSEEEGFWSFSPEAAETLQALIGKAQVILGLGDVAVVHFPKALEVD